MADAYEFYSQVTIGPAGHYVGPSHPYNTIYVCPIANFDVALEATIPSAETYGIGNSANLYEPCVETTLFSSVANGPLAVFNEDPYHTRTFDVYAFWN